MLGLAKVQAVPCSRPAVISAVLLNASAMYSIPARRAASADGRLPLASRGHIAMDPLAAELGRPYQVQLAAARELRYTRHRSRDGSIPTCVALLATARPH